MAWEVEIKAHVSDIEGLGAVLRKRYGAGEAFDKRDAYYEKESEPGKTAFRLRNDGSPEAGCARDLVTLKHKAMRDGVEVNDEIEFSVSSPLAFDAFARSLGYRLALEKRKRGRVWEAGPDMHIELAEVSGLGGFVEIEAIVEQETGVEAAEARVRNMLAELGIQDSDIEPRYYTSLLRSLQG